MSTNKRYNEGNFNNYVDKSSHSSPSGNSSGNISSQHRNSGMLAHHGNKQRSRMAGGPGTKVSVPRPVNLPSLRKENENNDPSSHHLAGAAGSMGWHRQDEHPSSSTHPLTDHETWSQHTTTSRNASWTALSATQNPPFDDIPTQQSSTPQLLNQEEYPTLEAATHQKSQSSTPRANQTQKNMETEPHQQESHEEDVKDWKEDIQPTQPQPPPVTDQASITPYPSHRSSWYDDERHGPQGHHTNNSRSSSGYGSHHQTHHQPNTMHHGGYYAPVQMYHHGTSGRPMVQPSGYYGHVPYSDGIYHPAPPYYPTMYAPYPQHLTQNYMQSEMYPEHGIYPQSSLPEGSVASLAYGDDSMNGQRDTEVRDVEREEFENEQRKRAKELATKLKIDGDSYSSADKWRRGNGIQLIRRPNKGADNSQHTDERKYRTLHQENVPERTESLSFLLKKQKEEGSTELDWDAQVDAEQKRKDQYEKNEEKKQTVDPYTEAQTTATTSVAPTVPLSPSHILTPKGSVSSDATRERSNEWVQHHYRPNPPSEDYLPSAMISDHRFVNPIPYDRRRNIDDRNHNYRSYRGRGRSYYPNTGGRATVDRNQYRMTGRGSYGTPPTTPSWRSPAKGTKLYPGRGFRPKGVPPAPAAVQTSLTGTDQPLESPKLQFGQFDSKVEGRFDPFSKKTAPPSEDQSCRLSAETHPSQNEDDAFHLPDTLFPEGRSPGTEPLPSRNGEQSTAAEDGGIGLPETLMESQEEVIKSPDAYVPPTSHSIDRRRYDHGSRGGYRGRGRGRARNYRGYSYENHGRGRCIPGSPLSQGSGDVRGGRSPHRSQYFKSNGNFHNSTSPFRGRGVRALNPYDRRDYFYSRSASDTPPAGRFRGRDHGVYRGRYNSHDHGIYRGRGRDRRQDSPASTQNSHTNVSPKMQWIPKKNSEDQN